MRERRKSALKPSRAYLTMSNMGTESTHTKMNLTPFDIFVIDLTTTEYRTFRNYKVVFIQTFWNVIKDRFNFLYHGENFVV